MNKKDAELLISDLVSKADPAWPDKPELIVLTEATIERAWGWVIFHNSRKYLESKDMSHALAGNAPYFVNRDSGEVIETGTAHAVEHYIEEYEEIINRFE